MATQRTETIHQYERRKQAEADRAAEARAARRRRIDQLHAILYGYTTASRSERKAAHEELLAMS